jgi:deoxyribonuclease V
MQFQRLHKWNLNPSEAVQLQRNLASKIILKTRLKSWDIVAGADISYNRFSPTIYVGIVVWRASTNEVIERKTLQCECHFPYRTGLLTFREAPAVLQLFSSIQTEPDVVMLDGAGIAHPRRIGFASHVGLWLDRPTIGVAKTRLCGDYDEPDIDAACQSQLILHNECVGAVVRTKRNCKPLFISPGHHIDVPSAVRIVLASCRGYRIPEPTRLAHFLVNEARGRAYDRSQGRKVYRTQP